MISSSNRRGTRRRSLRTVFFCSAMALAGLTSGCEDKPKPAADKPGASAAAAGQAASGATTSAVDKLKAKAKAKLGLAGDDTALAHISAECDVVAYFHTEDVLKTELVKKHIVPAYQEQMEKTAKGEKGAKAKGLSSFMTAAGIDPMKNVKDIALCMQNIAAGPGAKEKMALIMQGDFEQGKVFPALKAHPPEGTKFVAFEIDGVKAMKDDANKDRFVADPGGGILIMASTEDMLKKSLKKSDASKTTFKVPESAPVSLVIPKSTIDKLGKKAEKSPFGKWVAKLTHVVFIIDPGTGKVEGRLKMTDEKSAIELGAFVKIARDELTKGGAKGSNPIEAMLMPLLNDVKIDSDGSDLVISMTIPEELREKMIKQVADDIRKGE